MDAWKLLTPLANRIANMVARAVVKRADDSESAQTLQVAALDGETLDDLEHTQPYGFTSVPKDGAQAVLLFVCGKHDHGLVLVVGDRRYRLKSLESGEVAVYDSNGSTVVLKKNGDIQLNPQSGTVKVTGDLVASGDVKAGTISLKTHVHSPGSLSAPSGGGTVTGSTGGPS
jgi:phage baseplate assembly protein V